MKPKQILASHRPSVVSRANQQAVVLAIQDTTDLDFSGLKQTTGLGFTCQTPQQEIKVHSCMAVSGAGEPLGLLHQHTWSRSQRAGKRGEYRKKATCDKESQRWLDTLTAAEKDIDPSVCLVHMGDREADIYDLFVVPLGGAENFFKPISNICTTTSSLVIPLIFCQFSIINLIENNEFTGFQEFSAPLRSCPEAATANC